MKFSILPSFLTLLATTPFAKAFVAPRPTATAAALARPSIIIDPDPKSHDSVGQVRSSLNSPRVLLSSSSGGNKPSISDLGQKIVATFTNVRVDGIVDNVDSIGSNVMEGDIGSRGELYAIVPYILGICVLIGDIPYVGTALTVVGGPLLLLAGVLVVLAGLNDLGPALSPWPMPPPRTNRGVQQGGIYAELRHPIYAGALYIAAGLSILSGSATRLVLTGLLYVAFSIKANLEEDALLDRYPNEYSDYMVRVPGRFFPESILSFFYSGDSNSNQQQRMPPPPPPDAGYEMPPPSSSGPPLIPDDGNDAFSFRG